MSRAQPFLHEGSTNGVQPKATAGILAPMSAMDRRLFLERALGGCALAAGAGLGPGLPWLEQLLNLGGTALAAEGLATLLEQAPVARHWVSVNQPDGCSACHDHETARPGHEHDLALIKCLLCARECLIDPGGGACAAPG